MRTPQRGTTLLELLVVLLVISVLASQALPAYRGHVLRTHRVDAVAALLALATAQERFYLQHDRYASDVELSAAPPDGLGIAADVGDGRYAVTINAADSGTFAATARATGAQAGDTACAEFRIDATGARSASDSAGRTAPRCWR